jgi:hypothetical protein
MTKRSGKKNRKKLRELNKILNRMDRLPVRDIREPDQIIGYDEAGLPTGSPTSTPAAPTRGEQCSWESFDFAAYKKKVLSDPTSRAVIEDFLKHRHREWELEMEPDLVRRAKARRGRARRNPT